MKTNVAVLILLSLVGQLTACGVELKKQEQEQELAAQPQKPRQPGLPAPIPCPLIADAIAKLPPPQTAELNTARAQVSNQDVVFSSDASTIRIYKLPNYEIVGTIQQKARHARLLLSGNRLVSVGKKSLTVFDVSDMNAPKELAHEDLQHEVADARIVASRVVFASSRVIGRIQHQGMRIDHCKSYPSYTQELYATTISSLALDTLAEADSIELLGSVWTHIKDDVITFYESTQIGAGAHLTSPRSIRLLPDGLFSEFEIREAQDVVQQPQRAISI